MSQKLKIKLVTPSKVVLEEEAEEVILQTEEGQIGIMANHEPIISILKPGEMIIVNNGMVFSLATAGGVIEMSENNLTILADTAERADEIELDIAEARAAELAEKLGKAEQIDITTYKTLQKQLEKEQARIGVFKKWKKTAK
jgi:F-type H+-transporting ATPase subunit epsilon